MTIVYDIAAKEVENAKNAPPEKKKAMYRFLDLLKDNRVVIAPVIGQILVEFIRKNLSSN